MGTMIYSPLAGGYLTGKYTGDNISKGRRNEFSFPPIDIEQGDKVVSVLREIGEAHGRAPSPCMADLGLGHNMGHMFF